MLGSYKNHVKEHANSYARVYIREEFIGTTEYDMETTIVIGHNIGVMWTHVS